MKVIADSVKLALRNGDLLAFFDFSRGMLVDISHSLAGLVHEKSTARVIIVHCLLTLWLCRELIHVEDMEAFVVAAAAYSGKIYYAKGKFVKYYDDRFSARLHPCIKPPNVPSSIVGIIVMMPLSIQEIAKKYNF